MANKLLKNSFFSMRKIISNSIGHNLQKAKFPRSSDFVCTACAEGKLILRPSYLKVKMNHLNSLNAFKVIYVVPFNHYLDHSGILWFSLTHLHDSPMCVFYRHETMHLLR
jgi:hypothetical protein